MLPILLHSGEKENSLDNEVQQILEVCTYRKTELQSLCGAVVNIGLGLRKPGLKWPLSYETWASHSLLDTVINYKIIVRISIGWGNQANHCDFLEDRIIGTK